MKNLFNSYDKREERNLKEKLMDFSGVDRRFINFTEVYYTEDNFIHVTIVDDLGPNKKDLVLLHGLGGSSVLYYKLFKQLMVNYRIYGIDLPGLGW
jgi:pimeloyl-ACP methyl ester carboxylesterase